MRTIIITIALAAYAVGMAGCSITADRYKVPTMSAHSDGNPERVAMYQCQDGYTKARDARGVLWCDSGEDLDRYPTDQREFTCPEGSIMVTDTHRPTECIDQGEWESIRNDHQPTE